MTPKREPFGSLDVVSFPKAFGASKGLGALQKPSEDTRRSFSKFLRPKPTSPVLGPRVVSGRGSHVLGEGRVDKPCLGRLLESSGFAWAPTSSLILNANKLPVLGYQTNFWESSPTGLHTWA